MKPHGVTLKHRDLMEVWKSMFRIHVPIYTNLSAHLIANGRSQHLSCGSAWSFDNYSDHGVVNGDTERTHLIFDVPINTKLKQQLDKADILSGEINHNHLITIEDKSKAVNSYPGDIEIQNGITTLKRQGLGYDAIAQFLNKKKVPPKLASQKEWSAKMVESILNLK
jgi:hypothetical protein